MSLILFTFIVINYLWTCFESTSWKGNLWYRKCYSRFFLNNTYMWHFFMIHTRLSHIRVVRKYCPIMYIVKYSLPTIQTAFRSEMIKFIASWSQRYLFISRYENIPVFQPANASVKSLIPAGISNRYWMKLSVEFSLKTN